MKSRLTLHFHLFASSPVNRPIAYSHLQCFIGLNKPKHDLLYLAGMGHLEFVLLFSFFFVFSRVRITNCRGLRKIAPLFLADGWCFFVSEGSQLINSGFLPYYGIVRGQVLWFHGFWEYSFITNWSYWLIEQNLSSSMTVILDLSQFYNFIPN